MVVLGEDRLEHFRGEDLWEDCLEDRLLSLGGQMVGDLSVEDLVEHLNRLSKTMSIQKGNTHKILSINNSILYLPLA